MDSSESQKTCRLCKQQFPATATFFSTNPRSPDGLLARCKSCDNAKQRAKYKRKSGNPEWTAKRRIRSNRNANLYYYRHKTPERALKASIRSYRWQKANPNKRRARVQRYRSRKYAASGTWTAADFAEQLRIQDHLCFYCRADLASRKVHADHYIPLARGGSNCPDNIVASCADCNYKKADKLPEEFSGRRKSRLPPPLIQTRCSDDSAPARSLDQITYAPPDGFGGCAEPTESAPIT
jgi:5-methylcytosine-specific restriction endonuclease McrA